MQVIVNPVAGKGAGMRESARVRQLLHDQGLAFDLAYTEWPGHATELARSASQHGYDAVVAVGGDGTANEVLNGLMQSRSRDNRLPLGILPVGTGNDFAHGVGVPSDLEDACRCLAGGHTRRIDVGRVCGGQWAGGRFVGNGVGIGFDVTVTLEAKKLRWVSGALAYLIAVLKTLFLYYKAPLITVEADGETYRQHYLMISAMNGQRFGGAFYTAPDARPDDGWLDLVLAQQVDRLTMLVLVGRYMQGTQLSHPKVQATQARRIRVRARGGLNSHADGEVFMIDGRELQCEIVPQQIDVICEHGEGR
jgi:YegS/Rv2252/BmrU family lipid kinase